MSKKVFRGKNMTSLLQHVWRECGREAKILSSRKCHKSGYEVEVHPGGEALLGVDDLFSLCEESGVSEVEESTGVGGLAH